MTLMDLYWGLVFVAAVCAVGEVACVFLEMTGLVERDMGDSVLYCAAGAFLLLSVALFLWVVSVTG